MRLSLSIAFFLVLNAGCQEGSRLPSPDKENAAMGSERRDPMRDAAKRFQTFIGERRACAKDSDCIHLNLGCPFGCNVPINRRFAAEAQAESERLEKTFEEGTYCEYECMLVLGVRCIERQCITH